MDAFNLYRGKNTNLNTNVWKFCAAEQHCRQVVKPGITSVWVQEEIKCSFQVFKIVSGTTEIK